MNASENIVVIDFNDCLQDTCLMLEGYEPKQIWWYENYCVIKY